MFAKNIQKLRKSNKLTQIQMAEKIGVAKTTYASYEQNRRMPDADIQKKIADYFNVSLDYLHGRNDKESEQEIDTLLLNHLDGLADLPKEEQERIIENLREQALFMINRAKNK